MENFKVKIGYPNKWIDYSNLIVKRDFHLENVIQARVLMFQLDMNRVNKITDRYVIIII